MVDVNKAVENPEIKALISDYVLSHNEALLGDIYEWFIMRSHFLIVTTFSAELKPDEKGSVSIQEGTKMSIPNLSNHANENFLPLFTDWIELSKWESIQKPTQTLVFGFDDIASLVLSDPSSSGVVINAFSDSLVLPRSFIEGFKTQKEIRLKGVSQQVITKDTEVVIGEPKDYPTEMVAAISKHLEGQDQVQRAWLRYMVKDGEASYLVIVDFEGNQAETSSGIGRCATPFLKEHYLDIMKYDDSSDLGKGLSDVVPFYEKEIKQGFFKKLNKRKST